MNKLGVSIILLLVILGCYVLIITKLQNQGEQAAIIKSNCEDFVQIVNTKDYCLDDFSNPIYQQTISVKNATGEEVSLYNTKVPKEDGLSCIVGSERIDNKFIISPKCNQLVFKVVGYETINDYMVDINTNTVILHSNNNYDSGQDFGYIQDIQWSDNGEYFILVEYPNIRGGWGKRAVYVGDSKGNFEIVYTKNDNFGPFTYYGEILDISINNRGVAKFSAKFSTQGWGNSDPTDSYKSQEFDSNFVYKYKTGELKEL